MSSQMIFLLAGLAILLICLLVKKITGSTVFPFAMTVLAADKPISTREGKLFSYGVEADAVIYHGALVVLHDGYARQGGVATDYIAVGIAKKSVDATGLSSGDETIEVEEGIFLFENSEAGDAIGITEIGKVCFIVDDQTVAKTSGTNTRSVAGYVRDVTDDGVFVEVRNTHSADGDLVAANNLSDVASAATTRANIGANKVVLQIPVATLVGTGVYRVVSPVAGNITKIWSVIDGVLTVGNATLTGKIGATAITSGEITITQEGSAAGDVDSATPSALNTVTAGDVVSVTVGGTNATASGAMVSILIET